MKSSCYIKWKFRGVSGFLFKHVFWLWVLMMGGSLAFFYTLSFYSSLFCGISVQICPTRTTGNYTQTLNIVFLCNVHSVGAHQCGARPCDALEAINQWNGVITRFLKLNLRNAWLCLANLTSPICVIMQNWVCVNQRKKLFSHHFIYYEWNLEANGRNIRRLRAEGK